MVRTLKELNKLIEDKRQDEITEEEWNTVNTLINAITSLLKPFVDVLENQYGQFLEIMDTGEIND